jgi:hypothetical protein
MNVLVIIPKYYHIEFGKELVCRAKFCTTETRVVYSTTS